jgi:hypothetical protein
MFLTDSNNIKEVLLFPAMKPVKDEEVEHQQQPANNDSTAAPNKSK